MFLLEPYLVHNGKAAPIYYYRDTDQKEIDLLIVQDGKVYPAEIRKTASPRKDDMRHFSMLKKLKMPVGGGVVICLCDSSMPLSEDVTAINIAQI
jgi:predicted AAA+ superfamily ATPase